MASQMQKSEVSTQVRNVQNVALADATAKQQPSLWTWRMVQVCYLGDFVLFFHLPMHACILCVEKYWSLY